MSKITKSEEKKGQRIAKVIAASGFCSRRQAEELIAQNRVQVNGKLINSPAILITDESIKIDNKLINSKQETRLFLMNKPREIIVTNHDEKGRKTIFEILPEKMPRLVTVGRLDYNSEGLILLTTNGELARFVELPKTKWIRKYRVRVFGKIDLARLKALKNGITIDGVRYNEMICEVESDFDAQKAANNWLKISISEGKNREIRKVMEHLGLKVNRLIRTSYGPFLLDKLKVGQIIEVNKKQLESFLPAKFL